MSDTEVIIKIPEEIRLAILNGNLSDDQQTICDACIQNALLNGTIIPKDHGRIGDLDKILLWMIYKNGINDKLKCGEVASVFKDATIIEADDVEGIHDLPPVTQQSKWTPVTEKPPKENEWYQCTVILDDLSLTMDLYYKNDRWLDNRAIKMFNTYDIYGYGYDNAKHKLSYQELISEFDWTEKVVAWMPSPKPYKAESEI